MNRFSKMVEKVAAIHPDVEANALVGQIADWQKEKVRTLDVAGEAVQKMEIESATVESQLLGLIEANPAVAASVVAAMKSGRVNTGDLNSRLVDAIEKATGKSVYPPRWDFSKAKWDIVSSN